MPGVTVVIRATDDGELLSQALKRSAGQSRPPDQILVIDARSSHRTAAAARDAGAEVVSIPDWSYTPAVALNRACLDASGDIIVVLTDAELPADEDWLERLVAGFGDPGVALVDVAENAIAFRADLWRDRPFRVDVGARHAEEWAQHWRDRAPPTDEPAWHQRPMRLVVAIDEYPNLSETFVTNEIAALLERGHTITVEASVRSQRANWDGAPDVPVRFLEEDDRRAKLEALVWLVRTHPLRVLRDLASRRRWRRDGDARRLRELAARARRIDAERVEHLHVHFAAGAALDTMRIAAILSLPYSVTAHAYDIFKWPSNLREKLERAAVVTTGCDYNVHHLRCEVAPPHGERIHKIVMGVDTTQFRRRRAHPGGRSLLAVGRLVEKKGFGDLIDAVALLERDAPIDRLIVVGDGTLRERLERQVRELGLGHRVSFAGAEMPEHVRARLEETDVLVMPCVVAADGDRDSMPVVVKEALAMEVPVVATREVGLPELVRPGWGRLAPPRDPAALAAAIRDLLAQPADTRAAMGRAGRAWVEDHCYLRAETAKLETLIGRAVDGPPPATPPPPPGAP